MKALISAVLLLALSVAGTNVLDAKSPRNQPILSDRPAQIDKDCSQDQIGELPLNDLKAGFYQGFQGGLYFDGRNDMPESHFDLGMSLASQVVPLDGSGSPDAASGKIVLISIGISSTRNIFSGQDTDGGPVVFSGAFKPMADADPDKNPQVVIVNGAQGGSPIADWISPSAPTWDEVDSRLTGAGVTPAQVQVVWEHLAERAPTESFPTDALTFRDDLETVLRNIKIRYPNVKIAFLSSRLYGGYAPNSSNPEPYAYQHGFAIRFTIEDQINGDGNINADPNLGPVVAPWVAWGPYLWADGINVRSDGLTWLCSDFDAEGVHPVDSGVDKAAGLLLSHFKNNPATCSWFTTTPCPPQVPVAFAGTDQTITDSDGDGIEPVMLDGSDSYDPDGSITTYEWSENSTILGYGETLNTSFAVGTHQVLLTVSDDDGSTSLDSLAVTVNESFTDDLPTGDIAVKGDVTNDYTATHNSDDNYESILETESGGKKSNRYSYLEHKWTINVTGGSSVTFYLEAYKSMTSDGDDFEFAYSTDDANYTNMLTVTKTVDDDQYQTYTMPATLSGNVYVRVLDTDQMPGNRDLDEIYVDHLFIRSNTAGSSDTEPPSIPGNLQAVAFSSSQIDLTWDSSTDNQGVSGYNIYRDTSFLTSTTGEGYTDLGLNASTEYCYQVSAFDAAGNESGLSNTACATTLAPGSMHVENIAIDYSAGGPWNRYTPSVLILDNASQPVSNATVTGEWSGALSGSETVSTGPDGIANYSQSKTRSNDAVTFCVTAVVHSSYTYAPAQNVESCESAQLSSSSKNRADDDLNETITEFRLSQNYPNPFNPTTTISYQIVEAGLVSLNIYDLEGKLVKSLVNIRQSPGAYAVTWKGRNQAGTKVGSGVYLYELRKGEFIQRRRMILLK